MMKFAELTVALVVVVGCTNEGAEEEAVVCDGVSCPEGTTIALTMDGAAIPGGEQDVTVRAGGLVESGVLFLFDESRSCKIIQRIFTYGFHLSGLCRRTEEAVFVNVQGGEAGGPGPTHFEVEVRLDELILGRQFFDVEFEHVNPRGPIPECGPGCDVAESEMILLTPLEAALKQPPARDELTRQ